MNGPSRPRAAARRRHPRGQPSRAAATAGATTGVAGTGEAGTATVAVGAAVDATGINSRIAGDPTDQRATAAATPAVATGAQAVARIEAEPARKAESADRRAGPNSTAPAPRDLAETR